MLHQFLARNKVKSNYINSSKEALQQILDNPEKWNVILCDQIMPELNGTDILKRLRDENILIPFIIHSGHIDGAASNPHLKLADHIIKKPASRDKIINILQKYI
ncbi:MAG: response regulator [Alcanivoracaceae bacterium]|nr:response regulator [Alcanivoracaceae bacterium]